MIHSNSQYVQELMKVIKKEDNLRHEIIYFETLVGAYQARKENPEKFILGKQTTSQILEAECIAMQRRNTLEILKDNSPLEVYKKLSKKTEKVLENGSVKKEGLYKSILQFSRHEDLILIAGNKLEETLSGGKEITKEMDETGEDRRIFLSESNTMKSGLDKEIEEIKNHKKTKNLKYSIILKII